MTHDERKLIKKKNKYANEDNYTALAETCQRLGDLYKDHEEHQRALNEYKLAAKAYEKLNRYMDRGLAYRMIGEMHLMMGQFKEALQNVQAYMRAARKEVNTMELQRANVTLGRVHLHRAECHLNEKKLSEAEADLIEAEKAFHMGLSICHELQGTVHKTEIIEMQAGIYLNLGVTLDRRGKTEVAQDHMERAIRLAREADLFELLHTCYNTMALSSSKWERKDGNRYCGKTLRLLNHGLEVASRLPSRALKMCQTLLLKADFFLKMGDFQSARQTLKRAYYLKTPVSADAKQIAQQLKVLVALCQTEDELITIETTNYVRRKALYERMGDGACKLRNFSKAIDYYMRMLECAQALGEAGRQLIPCYVSLYQTYMDNRQYGLALEYLWKEHEIIADEPKEAYQTLLQIAKLYERQKKSFFDIEDIYRRARDEAKKLKSIELERIPVHRAIKLLRGNCMDLMADKLEQEAIASGIDTCIVEPDSEEVPDADEVMPDEGEDGEEHNTPNVGDEINLDIDLSDNTDVEGEANLGGGIGKEKELNNTINDGANRFSNSPRPRTRKRGMTFAVRRNNKGETQLHQAAIAGNAVLVERLLEQGHPVNVRDHAGWLPLHEACIHGHAEIVTVLLDRGAHLNDKGGTSCDGITPLYDACCNGRLDVIEVLLDRGANATQRTDFNDTALNVLDAWYAKCRTRISSAESEQYGRIRERLVTKFDAVAIQVTSPTPAHAKETHASSSAGRRSSRRRVSSSDSESQSVCAPSDALSPKPRSLQSIRSGSSGYGSGGNSFVLRHRNTTPDTDNDKSNSEQLQNDENSSHDELYNPAGVSEYHNVMKALRKNKSIDNRTQSLSLSAQKKRLAHMTMDEIDADDWLIDDLQQSAKKSRVSRDLQRTCLAGLERKKSSSSLDKLPSSNVAVKNINDELAGTYKDSTAACYALLDTDDEDACNDDLNERDHTSSGTQRSCPKDSAFNVLMKNSAKSFRRTQTRSGSSESCTSLIRRHSSGAQSSLLDAGFQRVASPSFDEKENARPAAVHLFTPEKTICKELSSQQPYSVESSCKRAFHVVLDDGETFTLTYDDQLPCSTHTVGWLQNEVARQYMMNHGKRPVVKLRPAGPSAALCSLSDTDSLDVLTKNGTTVHGQVCGLEQINFEQFYDDYCQEYNIASDKELRKRLVKMERSQLITLEPDFAKTVPSTPLPTADTLSFIFMLVFFQQDWLNHLDLSVNGITDKDMEKLARYLASCRHLRVLRLRLNLLTSRSVEMLCFGVKDSSDVESSRPHASLGGLKASTLEELDLSHNPLQDAAIAPLAMLCDRLLNLRTLRLRSTDITTFEKTDHRSFDISRLETFDISENELTEQSLQHLLQHLADGRLREANFHSLAVLCTDFKRKLWQTISSNTLTALNVLNLTNCRLTDDEVESILLPSIARNCENLRHLDLSLNLALTKRSFLAVFRQCNGAVYRLEQVRFVHDVQLWAELEAVEQADQLLQLIEFNPSSHYPSEIHAMLPAYGYSSDRHEALITVIGKFWRSLRPSRRSSTTREPLNGLHVILSVE